MIDFESYNRIPDVLPTLSQLGNSTDLSENLNIIQSYLQKLYPEGQFHFYIDAEKCSPIRRNVFFLVSDTSGSIRVKPEIETLNPTIEALLKTMHHCIQLDNKSADLFLQSPVPKAHHYVIPLGENGILLLSLPENTRLEEKTIHTHDFLFQKTGFVLVNCLNYKRLTESQIDTPSKIPLSHYQAPYRQLADNLNEGLTIMTPELVITYCNSVFAQMVGLEKDAVRNSPISNFLLPECFDRLKQNVSNTKKGENVPFELRLNTPKEPRWTLVSSAFIEDAFLGTQLVSCSFLDIHEKKISETKLSDREQLMSQLISSINDYFWIFDIDKRGLAYSGPNFHKIFGAKTPNPVKNPFRLLRAIHPNDIEKIKKTIRGALHFEEINLDFRILTLNTTKVVRIKAFPISDPGGKPKRFAGIASDITRQTETEEKLFETSQQLINTITAMGDFLFLVDEQQKIVSQIPLAQTLGYKNKFLKDVDIPKEAKRLILHAFQVLKYSSQPISYDIMAKGDNHNMWFNLTITRRENRDKSFGGIAVHSREITQRIVAQEELKISSNVDEIIANTSTRFINIPTEKIGNEIGHVLEQIGHYLSVDYGFVYLLQLENKEALLHQRWERKIKEKKIVLPAQIPLQNIKSFLSRLKKGENITYYSTEKPTRSYRREKELLDSLQIQSANIAPIISENQIIGFIGFASSISGKLWNKHHLRLIKLLGEIFANAITRKNKQELLDIATSKLSTIIQNLNSGVLLENSQNSIEHTNQKFCDLFHIEVQASELIGRDKQAIDIVTAEDNENPGRYLKQITRHKEKQEPTVNEELFLKNGKIFERDYTPIFYNNILDGHFWQYRDITEKKLTEQLIKQNELRLKYALEAANEAIWEWSIPNDTLYLSPRWFEITHIPSDSVETMRTCLELVLSDYKEAVVRKLEEIKEGKINRFELEFQIHVPKSSHVWILMKGKSTEFQHEIPLKIVGTISDITEQKNLEFELIDQKATAEEATEAKSRFLANISHEIRTPMHGIVGLTELLYGTKLGAEQRKFLDAIKASSNNMLTILNDLLDISKITEGKLTTENTGFELISIMSTLYYTLQNLAKKRNNQLTLDLDNTVAPILVGDPVRLNQILLNLLNNALKFTESGTVTCKITCKKTFADKQKIRFAVIDTGIGIKAQDLNNVFERFNQGSQVSPRKYGGTGLGLTISKQLVEMLGGNLCVRSVQNQGTIFWFNLTLPVGQQSDIQGQIKNIDYTLIPKNKKILVAEDNPTNIVIIKTALRNMGNEPCIVTNGAEALKEVERTDFDLIIMDIQMPVVDGYEATKIIREKYKLTTPIIGLSAETNRRKIKKYIEAGMNDFLPKPFDLEQLISVINTLLTVDTGKEKSMETGIRPTFSMDKIRYLTNNNREQISQLIETFLENTCKNASQIKEAYEAKDWETLYKVAHRIKPAIDTLDIVPLNKIIRQLEVNAQKQLDSEQTKNYVSEILRLLSEVCKDLRKIKGNI
jgi:PAS domain S-box-containing protein